MGRFLFRALLAAAPLAIVMTIAATCFGQVAPAPAPDLPPGLNVTDVLNAIAQHQWLALVLLVAVYLRKLLSPGSAFPWTVPVNWRPAIVGAAGLVVAVVSSKQAGSSWESSLVIGATGGALTTFLDGLVVALFGSPAAAPSWAKAILAIIEDVAPPPPPASGSGGGVSKAPLSAVVNEPPKPPPASARTRVGSRVARVVWPWALGGAGLAGAVGMGAIPVAGVVATGAAAEGCTAAQWANTLTAIQTVLQYISTYIPLAQSIWSWVIGLLPAAVQPAAQAAFNDAIGTLEGTAAAAQDAIAAGTTPTNPAAILANLQAAAQAVANVIALYVIPGDAAPAMAVAKTAVQQSLVMKLFAHNMVIQAVHQ
jgi:hypothetical protein